METEFFANERNATVKKAHYYVFSAYGVFCALLILVDLALSGWYEYCFWEFGLVHSSLLTYISNLNNEGTISEAKTDACGAQKGAVESYCPGVCSALGEFDSAGIVMLFFGIITLIFQVTVIYFHLHKLKKPWFKMSYTWFLMISPFAMYLIGFITFLITMDPTGLSTPSNPHIYATDHSPKDFAVKPGISLCIAVIAFLAIQAVYGLLVTRKAFI